MRASARFAEHVGEWKVTVRADTVAGVFVELARFIARACGHPRGPRSPWERVSLAARDTPTLLADWANELLGRSEVDGRSYDSVRRLRIDDGTLTAEICGRAVSAWQSPLKAATYHGLTLERIGTRWAGTVLFDV
jgi:SHS2 domain-containing protein